jgi:hypothetical protein
MTDLLLANGTIHTMDPARPVARSIACSDGRIESLDETPRAKRSIDLRGRTVVPGFVDAHVHLLAWGRRKRELDLSGVTSLEELARRVEARAKGLPEGEWVIGSGYDLAAPPDPGAIARAAAGRPVWLMRKDGHSGVASARAAAQVGLPRPAGAGAILAENEAFVMDRLVPRPSPASDFLAAQREAIQSGITSIHDAKVDEEYLRMLRSLDEGRQLRLRVHAMFWHEDPDRVIEFMRAQKPVSGRLSVRAVKLFMDGSLGSGTAWMLDPFETGPCAGGHGVPVLPAGDAERVARAALSTGYQVCAHAIGDRANRELLGVYERVDPPAEARWRIEHAQHVHPDDLARLRRWTASVQPSHAAADRKLAEERLGAARTARSYRWRGAGRLALGTDAPVEPLDPRRTFHCAVTREGWEDGEALTPPEALHGMTAGAAWAGFSEAGVLAPGRPADMAILSDDWLRAPGEAPSSRVLGTLMDGRVASLSRELSA